MLFAVGASSGASGSPGKEAAERFTEAWARKDFATMYRELNEASRRSIGEDKFAKAYKESLEGCYACHKSVGRPYLKPMIPTTRVESSRTPSRSKRMAEQWRDGIGLLKITLWSRHRVARYRMVTSATHVIRIL